MITRRAMLLSGLPALACLPLRAGLSVPTVPGLSYDAVANLLRVTGRVSLPVTIDISGAEYSGLRIVGPGKLVATGASFGMRVVNVPRLSIEGLDFEGFPEAGLTVWGGTGNRFASLRFDRCGSGYNSDFSLWHQKNFECDGIQSYDSGFGPHFAVCTEGAVNDVIAMRSKVRGIKFNQCHHLTGHSLTAHENGDTGLSISGPSSYLNFSGVSCLRNTKGIGVGVWFSSEGNHHCTLVNVVALDNRTDIAFWQADHSNVLLAVRARNVFYDQARRNRVELLP